MAAHKTSNDLAPGLLLMAAAALGLIVANTSLSPLYDALRDLPMSVRIGGFAIDKPLLLWINDGLMAVFFFFVGLELKREFLRGELSTVPTALLPAVCALGGMIVPAAIYFYLNAGDDVAIRGWAIPAATDIAFALGILALAGSSVPIGIKILLTAIAIIDDVGAIAVIAVFYTDKLSYEALAVWAAAVAVLAFLNRFGVLRVAPYVVVAVIAWAALLKSGVHATLAGVIAAFFIPMAQGGNGDKSPLDRLEEDLKPVVAFFIVPLFGFCNAGVSFAGLGLDALFAPVTLGIALGLFIGKQIGIMLPFAIVVGARMAPMPAGATWLQVYAMSILCGIGFTMSLFIAGLAFTDPAHDAPVRLGVLAGSILSALTALALFRLAARQTTQRPKA
jgi:NhaA family Na+:H+ antiporter